RPDRPAARLRADPLAWRRLLLGLSAARLSGPRPRRAGGMARTLAAGAVGCARHRPPALRAAVAGRRADLSCDRGARQALPAAPGLAGACTSQGRRLGGGYARRRLLASAALAAVDAHQLAVDLVQLVAGLRRGVDIRHPARHAATSRRFLPRLDFVGCGGLAVASDDGTGAEAAGGIGRPGLLRGAAGLIGLRLRLLLGTGIYRS